MISRSRGYQCCERCEMYSKTRWSMTQHSMTLTSGARLRSPHPSRDLSVFHQLKSTIYCNVRLLDFSIVPHLRFVGGTDQMINCTLLIPNILVNGVNTQQDLLDIRRMFFYWWFFHETQVVHLSTGSNKLRILGLLPRSTAALYRFSRSAIQSVHETKMTLAPCMTWSTSFHGSSGFLTVSIHVSLSFHEQTA
jgi:hypothetical protein